LICLGYLSTLMCLQNLSHWYNSKSIDIDMYTNLSTWYVLDIYQHWCASKIYHIDRTPNLSTLICIQIYQLDMSWILSTPICFGYLSTLI
jgi:hypothetical protein